MQNYYFLIFTDSFCSSLILSMRAEMAWFAALGFGGYDMPFATVMAFLGATLATGIDFVLGYYISVIRARWFHFTEASYLRASKYFTRYFIILLLFPWIPFTSLFAMIAGIFRVPPWRAMTVIALGRVLYYSYYYVQS